MTSVLLGREYEWSHQSVTSLVGAYRRSTIDFVGPHMAAHAVEQLLSMGTVIALVATMSTTGGARAENVQRAIQDPCLPLDCHGQRSYGTVQLGS